MEMHLEVSGVIMVCQAQTKPVGTKGKGQRLRSDSVFLECTDRAGGMTKGVAQKAVWN